MCEQVHRTYSNIYYCLMRDRRQKENWSSCRTCIFRQRLRGETEQYVFGVF